MISKSRFLLLALLVAVAPCYADVTMEGFGVVTNVVDGNHIICRSSWRNPWKLRLDGISPPALSDANGSAAREALALMVLGSNIHFQVHSESREGDYFYAWVDAGDNFKTHVNLKMIQLGWAKAERFRRSPPRRWSELQGKPEDVMAAAEQKAREEKLGMWKDEEPFSSAPPGDGSLRRADDALQHPATCSVCGGPRNRHYPPAEWLTKQTSVAAAESDYLVADKRRGPEPVPFGHSNAQWLKLKEKIKPGDELWEFSSPTDSWKMMAGRAGLCVIRNGCPIGDIMTRMN